MNDEQGSRLNKVLKIIGYGISAVVVWIYSTKGVVAFLFKGSLTGADYIEAYLIMGLLWPILGTLIANGGYHLCTWICTGKSKSLFDRRTDQEVESKDE